MIVHRQLDPKIILFYTWKNLLYSFLLATAVYLVNTRFEWFSLAIPSYAISALGTALAIFLAFKNNQAYDRWWEARKIWGLCVNYSRGWARQVTTLIFTERQEEEAEVRAFKQRLAYRHAAYVHALRVFLRKPNQYGQHHKGEYMEAENSYQDTKPLLIEKEFKVFCQKDNPPNYLNQLQGQDLQRALRRGWISEFRLVQMDQTLIEFNNIQGRSERIKNTPLPRPYSFFSRIFVFIFTSLLPFVFVGSLGWGSIPVSVLISFVFNTLDLVGERTEDPFENKLDDVPITSISETIERNIREQLGERDLPAKSPLVEGIEF